MLTQISYIILLLVVEAGFSTVLKNAFPYAPHTPWFLAGTGYFLLKFVLLAIVAFARESGIELTRWKFEPFDLKFFYDVASRYPTGSSVDYFQTAWHSLNALCPIALIFSVWGYGNMPISLPWPFFACLFALWLVLWIMGNLYFAWRWTSVAYLSELAAIVHRKFPDLAESANSAPSSGSCDNRSSSTSVVNSKRLPTSNTGDSNDNESAEGRNNKDPLACDESLKKYIASPKVAKAICTLHIMNHLNTALATAILFIPFLAIFEGSPFFCCAMLQFLVDGMILACLDCLLYFDVDLKRFPIEVRRKSVFAPFIAHIE